MHAVRLTLRSMDSYGFIFTQHCFGTQEEVDDPITEITKGKYQRSKHKGQPKRGTNQQCSEIGTSLTCLTLTHTDSYWLGKCHMVGFNLKFFISTKPGSEQEVDTYSWDWDNFLDGCDTFVFYISFFRSRSEWGNGSQILLIKIYNVLPCLNLLAEAESSLEPGKYAELHYKSCRTINLIKP